MRYQRRSRAGFTLIEMMVATALVLVIMLIITQAFASASKTFTTLRTAGYMQERLRTGINVSRKDLGSDHFAPPYLSNRGGPHVSDQRLDQAGWQPPYRGYFEYRQLGEITGGPSVLEPTLNPRTDGDGLTSTRAVSNRLRFTVRLPDGPATELFTAQFHPTFTGDSRVNAFVNGQSLLYTRWAEITYLLWPMQDSTSPTGFANTKSDGTGLPRYTLRRRVRLLAPASVDYYMQPAQAIQIILACAQYIDVIPPFIAGPAPDSILVQPQYGPNTVILRMPGPEALNAPDVDYTPTFPPFNSNQPTYVKRLKFPEEVPDPTAYLPDYQVHPTGDDIVMTDVLSMDIKAAWFFNPAFDNLVQSTYPYPQFPYPSPPNAPPIQPALTQPPPSNAALVLPPSSVFAGMNMDEPFWDLQPSLLAPGNARWFDTGKAKLVPFPQTDPSDWDNPGTFGPAPQSPGFLTPGTTTVPTRINVRALQIKFRVWDPRAEQARQATIVSEV
jgi:prepilin-type N-terminal cleavage/methylation domain-containing protein